MIKIGTYPFRVGAIRVTRFRGVIPQDWPGAQDIMCVLYEIEADLKGGDSCGGYQVHLRNCLPTE